MAKEAQKKKLNKKKSADGEISRSAERDKATRLDGAAFYKKAGEKFWKGHAIKLFKTLWEPPFLFFFQELLGGWCELSRAGAGQERREALFPKRGPSAPRSPFPPANSSAAFSFGERGAKEKAKQKEKRRWGERAAF